MRIPLTILQLFPDLICVAIVLLFLIFGYHRGMFRTLSGLMTWLVSLFGAKLIADWGAPWLADLLLPRVQPYVTQRLAQAIAEGASSASGGEGLGDLGVLGLVPGVQDLLEGVTETRAETIAPAVAQQVAQAIGWLILFVLGFLALKLLCRLAVLLLDLVDEGATRDQYSLRRDVLQARKDSLKLQGDIWGGFAAQIRSVREYYDRSMQLLDPAIRAELFCAERPIRAKATDKSSAYIGPDGYCENSLIADGCNIEGVVENSILFPGVVVEAGAVVRNCVLFKETAVRRGAAVSHLIADKNVEILPDRTLMGHSSYPIVLAKGSQV